MAEECKKERSLRSAIIGTSIIFWILAIFLINSMNAIKTELETANQFVQSYMYMAGQSNLAGYQLVDPEGKTVYTFQRLPELEMDMLDESEGACPLKAKAEGKCGAKAESQPGTCPLSACGKSAAVTQ